MTSRSFASWLNDAHMSQGQPDSELNRIVTGILIAWLAAAVVAGGAGLVTRIGRGLAPVVVTPVLVFVAAFALAPRMRAWFLGLNPRSLVLFHLVRFVGVAFLVLHARGRLPSAFALPAGWGDIAMAATAPLAALCIPPRTDARRRLFIAWNLVGAVDILNAVSTAGRLRFRNPADMAAMTEFPLSLVPTFLVPLILITHIILVAQVWKRRDPQAAP
jgi:hypothetical protein